MNSLLRGPSPVIAGLPLVVEDGAIGVAGVRPVAGDGVARALARLVDDTVAADARERAIAVDQTNTSVIVDERLVVKIVGSWAAADRAARLLERLTAAGSLDVARTVGSVRWRHPERGESTLAIVTEFLPDAEDGWTWAVDDAVGVLGGGSDPGWPATLGAAVARVHLALATDAAAAADDTPTRRRARAEDALGRAVDATPGAEGARLRNRAVSLARDIRSLSDAAPGLEFAIHGDLHVGQVLRSPGGDGAGPRYTVIDFDGDPQLDAAERERPDAAARDVAHLLVSLDLVAAVAQKRLQRAEPAAFDWADRARADLLAAYLAELGGAGRADLFDAALLPGFEAEQLVAELRYAERFLPRWRYAPDAAITRRHPSTDEHPEDPWTPPPFEPTST
ncbi:hypothetical protein [Agromyces sp. LHK192]|uniref:hypothetical protein n=1 Tax=Agromyces sp. LHK192 TaxID=2498704 RepID=UPI000FD8503E|nr:hypothetical protein [Agromyces sp. LHK192]